MVHNLDLPEALRLALNIALLQSVVVGLFVFAQTHIVQASEIQNPDKNHLTI